MCYRQLFLHITKVCSYHCVSDWKYAGTKFSPILLSAPAMLPTMAGNMDRQSDSKRHKQPQKRYVIRQSHKVMRQGLTWFRLCTFHWVSKISFYLQVFYVNSFASFSLGAFVNVYAIFSATLCVGLSVVLLKLPTWSSEMYYITKSICAKNWVSYITLKTPKPKSHL